MKWSISQRKNKKNKLTDVWLRLLIETMIMETWYLIEKQHLKQVKRFLKKLSKYLTRKDSGDWVIVCIPKESMIQEFDEITTKKELYRLFNFYIPIWKILRISDQKLNTFTISDLYTNWYHHATSDVMMDQIINLCEANETLSSQCEIIFDKEQLKKIITDATVVRKKKRAPTQKRWTLTEKKRALTQKKWALFYNIIKFEIIKINILWLVLCLGFNYQFCPSCYLLVAINSQLSNVSNAHRSLCLKLQHL